MENAAITYKQIIAMEPFWVLIGEQVWSSLSIGLFKLSSRATTTHSLL